MFTAAAWRTSMIMKIRNRLAVLCVAFARDGMRAAAGGSLGNIVVWDVD